MKDKLETTLKNLQAPAPDPEARLRAKRAALAEFERVQTDQSRIERVGPLQALWRRLRPSREHTHGSTSMNWFTNRGFLAGAAGVCVVAVGVAIVLPNLSQQAADVGDSKEAEYPASLQKSPADAPTPETYRTDMSAPAEAAAAASPEGSTEQLYRQAPELEAYAEPKFSMPVEPSIEPSPPPEMSAPASPVSAKTDERDRGGELGDVTVKGFRANLKSAQEMKAKRQADTAVDSISSEDIGQFPGGVAGNQQGLLREEANDKFEHFEVNPIHRVADQPWSTFSLDVDTASYSFVRGQLNDGYLPQKDSVRAEEMINYFEYSWPAARSRSAPFKPTVVVSDSPWNKGKKLIHIGIKGYDIDRESAPDANLVLLLDVSGSMNEPDKLPLAVRSMELLLDSLKPTDTVAIVVYAGAAGTVLEPTPVRQKGRILEALKALRAGGSTAGAQGIERAYELAERSFRRGGVNRILLCTDGDFNVGINDTEELKGFVERKREKGVYLSVLGFGQGNYRDELAQALAQNGNGVAAYIDTEQEARKVLVEQASGSLFTIAKDVKIQVEFEPATVSEYRLVGYETRTLRREDFNNDAVDAGDVGAGHTVTAIYEITPVGVQGSVDEPRYESNRPKPSSRSKGSEYGFLKIRYKLPSESSSKLISEPIPLRSEDVATSIARDVRFSTAVAGFAQLLRGGQYTGSLSYDDVIREAKSSGDDDRNGYRAEFVELVRKAKNAGSED